ncbi:Vam6/VPS39/TRAP1 family like protein, partial [Aduncisulcus paluster]
LSTALLTLCRHYIHVDSRLVFTALPDALPVRELRPYIGVMLSHLQLERRKMVLKRGLLSARYTSLEKRLIDARNVNFEVDKFSVCQVCGGRIGTRPFTVYPNGFIACEECGDRQTDNIGTYQKEFEILSKIDGKL